MLKIKRFYLGDIMLEKMWFIEIYNLYNEI